MRNRLLAFVAALLAFGAAAEAEVVIGVAGPMSGAFATIGQEMVDGVEAAVADINASGGIGGEPARVEIADDKCDATAGAAVANQLVGRGARLVVGHACTGAALAAAGVYDENAIVFVSPAATNPRLTDERVGPGVFRLSPRSDAQAQAIGAYLLARHPSGRVAFVHDGSVYGQGLVEAARTAFEARGGQAVVTQAYTPGERSQNALVGVMQDAAPDAVVIGGLQADAAVIAGGIRARGLDAEIIGSEALGLEEFRDLAGPAAEGVVFALPSDPRQRPEAAALVSALRGQGIEPTGATIPAYAAVQVYADAVQAVGDDAFEPVVEAISSRPFGTVLGEVRFDGKGDRTGTGWSLFVWRSGAPVPLP
jgi:branched-chain amino acid transport system substrate-binding protein